MIDLEVKTKIKQAINVLEMDSKDIKYSQLYIYNDGPNDIRQITVSFGVTEYGNLKKLIEIYIADGGKYADQFQPFLNLIGKTALVNNADFKRLLIASAKEDSIMRTAQDKVYDLAYWDRAYKWFNANGFTLPLSMGVIMDSFVHSGGILDVLRQRFSEKTPASGGNEKEWVAQYLAVRREWLANHKKKILNNTVYRIDFFLKQTSTGNWDFVCPLVPHGVNIC
jgi:chitosanase